MNSFLQLADSMCTYVCTFASRKAKCPMCLLCSPSVVTFAIFSRYLGIVVLRTVRTVDLDLLHPAVTDCSLLFSFYYVGKTEEDL